MTSWTSGYVADLVYTHGYYREMTPEVLKFATLVKGLRSPELFEDRITYCELGCGQGDTINLIAAANPNVDCHATDFNPAQIAFARSLARDAGTKNVTFYDAAFEDFAQETTLPQQFDIIALHGIYSWISPANRAHIVQFIRKRLKVGGLVYISYNSMPGWANAIPLRRLMVDAAAAAAGPTADRISQALSFISSFAEAKPVYFAQNPSVAPRFAKLKEMPSSYLAHEYFNRDWTPFHFADVAAEMSEAKLSFAGSAHFLDHIDAVNLTTEQQSLLAGIHDPIWRESVRDHLINQQFRRDIYVRGPNRLSEVEARRFWSDQRFVISTTRQDIPMKVTGAIGEAQLQEDVYAPLLDALEGGPATVRDLAAKPKVAALGWPKLMQALIILVGGGHVQPARPVKEEGKRAQGCKALNAAILRRAEFSADLQFLASPVTGGAIGVDRFSQLFISAMVDKKADPVDYAWAALASQGQAILKDGKALETAAENIAELKSRYEQFVERKLTVLKQLNVA